MNRFLSLGAWRRAQGICLENFYGVVLVAPGG